MRNRTFSSWTSALAAGTALVFLGAAAPARALDGKAIFLAQKCNLCHSVSSADITQTSAKMKAPDLTGKVTAAEVPKLIRFVRKLEPGGEKKKNHSKEFKGTDEEIQAVMDWLVAQKAK